MSNMLWLGEKFISDDKEFKAADVLRKLDEVTIDDIQRVSRYILRSDHVNIASVGPSVKGLQKEIEKRFSDL